MYGVDRDDPYCIHTVEQLMDVIDEIGFLPLFKNEIPGFSVEERTVPDYWWSGDQERDPWQWREEIARSRRIAYGKFFNKKAGFISMKWLPVFVNYRRDGYDFDSLWEDGKASQRAKKIMDLFVLEEEELTFYEKQMDRCVLSACEKQMEKAEPSGKALELYSPEIKKKAGFVSGGEKNFDGTLTDLQMQLYLCPADFRQRLNKSGSPYGWPVAVYGTPEHLYGYDLVRSAYFEKPEVSGKKIYEYMKERYPVAADKDIRKVLNLKNLK